MVVNAPEPACLCPSPLINGCAYLALLTLSLVLVCFQLLPVLHNDTTDTVVYRTFHSCGLIFISRSGITGSKGTLLVCELDKLLSISMLKFPCE